MTGAKLFTYVWTERQRQEATSSGQTTSLNDNSPIMDRRQRRENTMQKFFAHTSIDTDPSLHILVEPNFAFEHDQGPDPSLCKKNCRLHQFLYDLPIQP